MSLAMVQLSAEALLDAALLKLQSGFVLKMHCGAAEGHGRANFKLTLQPPARGVEASNCLVAFSSMLQHVRTLLPVHHVVAHAHDHTNGRSIITLQMSPIKAGLSYAQSGRESGYVVEQSPAEPEAPQSFSEVGAAENVGGANSGIIEEHHIAIPTGTTKVAEPAADALDGGQGANSENQLVEVSHLDDRLADEDPAALAAVVNQPLQVEPAANADVWDLKPLLINHYTKTQLQEKIQATRNAFEAIYSATGTLFVDDDTFQDFMRMFEVYHSVLEIAAEEADDADSE